MKNEIKVLRWTSWIEGKKMQSIDIPLEDEYTKVLIEEIRSKKIKHGGYWHQSTENRHKLCRLR